MAEMDYEDVKITSPKQPGKYWNAHLYFCQNCQCSFFRVFYVIKQDHPHFECANCETMFCGTFNNTKCEIPEPDGIIEDGEFIPRQ